MELTDYLRAMGKRFFILLALPAVAAAIAFTILIVQPTQFSAKATVRLPVPTDAASSVITQANSDFSEALSSSATTTATSKATGVAPDAVSSGVSVAQSGGSRFIEVTFTTSRKRDAAKVVASAAKAALTDLLQPETTLKQKAFDEAQAQYDAARAKLSDASAGGATLPDDQYRQKIAQVGQLQVQLLQAQATNGTADPFGHPIHNDQAIQTFSDAIAAGQADLTRLEGEIVKSRPIQDAVTNALTNLGAAQRNLDEAKAPEAGVDAPGTITVTPATKIDKTKELLKTLGVVVAVAVVLSVALLVLLELLRPSSRRERRGADAGRVGPSSDGDASSDPQSDADRARAEADGEAEQIGVEAEQQDAEAVSSRAAPDQRARHGSEEATRIVQPARRQADAAPLRADGSRAELPSVAEGLRVQAVGDRQILKADGEAERIGAEAEDRETEAASPPVEPKQGANSYGEEIAQIVQPPRSEADQARQGAVEVDSEGAVGTPPDEGS